MLIQQMSDSSGSSSCAQHKSRPLTSVHKPASVASCQDDVTRKHWFSTQRDASEATGVGSLGVGSAFAKYVRREAASQLQQQQQRSDGPLTPASNTSSGEAETMAMHSQPSTAAPSKLSTKQQQRQHAVHPENSSDRSDDDDIAEDDDGGSATTSSSSDSENVQSKGQEEGGKHGMKRSRSGESDSRCKKQRLIWTPELHARFLTAVNHLGVKGAVPKTILQLMNVEGMTRENVASHLQKYRQYLKRLAGLPVATALSADTRFQVQSVQQQVLQHQARSGLHSSFHNSSSSHALQLAAAAGGLPLSLAGLPAAVSLAGGYQDLITQLLVASAGASGPSAGPSSASAAAASGLAGLQVSTMAALQRSQLAGVLPGILPLGFSPPVMAGFGGLSSALLGGVGGGPGLSSALLGEGGGSLGLNSALLRGGTGSLGLVSQVQLGNFGSLLQGGSIPARRNGASASQ